MNTLKIFWLSTAFISIAFAVVVTVILTYDFSNHTLSTEAVNNAEKRSVDALENTDEEPSFSAVPKVLPAPAKKLTKIINDSPSVASENAPLDKKIEQLDQRLTNFEEQMKAEGLVIESEPVAIEVTSSDGSDMQARLKAIQEHMKQK